jgi:uncharacterized protein YjiS (DUF1127 family)
MSMTTERFREDSFSDQCRIALQQSRAVAVAGASTIATTLMVWLERVRERRQLMSLGDRDLQDFGRSRADAFSEGSKPFWRA